MYKFENDVWITFEFNKTKSIGRTFINDIGINSVMSINEKLIAFEVPFSLVENPKILNILSSSDVKKKQMNFEPEANYKKPVLFNLFLN